MLCLYTVEDAKNVHTPTKYFVDRIKASGALPFGAEYRRFILAAEQSTPSERTSEAYPWLMAELSA